jgi:hypothetical protein
MFSSQEGMQKQDKALYSQLLTLRESIRALKTDLKKEREQCEEAFKNLEEISGTDFEDEVFVDEAVPWEKTNEKDENALSPQETWKHDRQDSGISVKTPEAEECISSSSSTHHTEDFSKSCTSVQYFKPELISHDKQDLNPHVKTINVELPQKKISNTKPVLIQHSKQDSGILLDEDAVRETKVLSKLVESSEMLERLENRKFDRIIQKKWNKVPENSSGNLGSQIYHQRSRSNNDLLRFQRSLSHQHSTPDLQALRYHKNSCPQIKLFTTHGTEVNFDSPSFNERNHLIPTHSRTNSCPQTITASTKPPNYQLVKGVDEKQQVQRIARTLAHVEKLRKDESPNQSHPSAPNDRPSFSLPLNTGSGYHTSRSVFKQNFIPMHQHTRSLPATPVRELSMAEDLLSRQENRGSMQNISDYKAITSKQVRPHKRSASFVDLGSLSEKENGGVRSSFGARNVSDVHDDQHVIHTAGPQGSASPNAKSSPMHHMSALQNNVKQARENAKDNTRTLRKANVVQVDSFSVFNQTRHSSGDLTRDQESAKDKSLTSYKASVVRVNSLPQGKEATLIPSKAKVVHLNNPKQSQENLTHSNPPAESKASTPLRAVLVSAAEVSVSHTTDRQPLSRKCSVDDRGSGHLRASDGPQRRFTITSYKTERKSPRLQHENGEFSSRFLAPKNHMRHHTMPEYDVIRRRHSLYAIHAPSKSWDGCANRKTSEFNRMVRSVSQVSFV